MPRGLDGKIQPEADCRRVGAIISIPQSVGERNASESLGDRRGVRRLFCHLGCRGSRAASSHAAREEAAGASGGKEAADLGGVLRDVPQRGFDHDIEEWLQSIKDCQEGKIPL
mgnify:CR=1 FL=1